MFDSHFMSDFIRGKAKTDSQQDLFGATSQPIQFTPAAQAVMDAGRELWRYYHSILGANRNASFYDIRAHFQGTDAKTGRMNNDSKDAIYNSLIADLRAKMKILAKQIEVGVYKYGFLYNGEPISETETAIVETPIEEAVEIEAPKPKSPKKKTKTIINHYHISGDLNIKNMINE